MQKLSLIPKLTEVSNPLVHLHMPRLTSETMHCKLPSKHSLMASSNEFRRTS
ncbi:hypothetical protein SOVF_015170 [Spinacia oleracea]|nr:hypothetical protein SOVF_015170 [Spinacia oleracea]